MTGMNLADYMPDVLDALDAEPDSRLAISLECISANDYRLTGVDLAQLYVRKADPGRIAAAGLGKDIDRLRRANDILRGRVLLGGGITYSNLRINIYDLGGNIRKLADDSEARGIVARILASEPVLGWLVADRQQGSRA